MDIERAQSLARIEREAQKSYWTEHSRVATVEAMMLDSKAADIDREERPEVLSMLGSVAGKRVVELGAGIGRFTGELAAVASTVLALDFMPNLIEENRRVHGSRHPNISYQAGDALELSLPSASVDVVFSNWLLMYLGDEEVATLAANALDWAAEGGLIFFRESCFRQSGDRQRSNNPTHYRNPREYFKIFDDVENREADGRYAHFELVSCKCVDTYVRVKHNQNQICWKWRKVVTTEPRQAHVRNFLDTQQYSRLSIMRYERIFGPGFVSTGGLETTKEFVKMLNLQPNQAVLDVGCGIGGGDFFMAAQHGAYVHGVDLSVNMVLIALERAAADVLGSLVSFEIADITACDVKEGTYDVIYSRDTLLHIHDKPALFHRFMRLLKPGGQLLISDYCRADADPSPEFAAYIAQRGYDLHSVPAYGAMLEGAGFEHVRAEDRTWQFEACLRKELKRAEADRAAFVKTFSGDDYHHVVSGWQEKLVRVGRGEQRWGLFRAVKPGNDNAGPPTANGLANGHASNGLANGHANGLVNGLANGHSHEHVGNGLAN